LGSPNVDLANPTQLEHLASRRGNSEVFLSGGLLQVVCRWLESCECVGNRVAIAL